jgi:hypothetical protein
MGVGGAQHPYSRGFPFWIQGKQVEPAPVKGRPDRTERPGFFCANLVRLRLWRNKLTVFSAMC